MKYWFLSLFLPFLLNADTTWQAEIQSPFALTIKLSSQEVILGELLNLEAEFQYPSSYQLNTEDLMNGLIESSGNPLFPSFNFSLPNVSTLSKEDRKIKTVQIKITPLMTGSLDLSFLTVTFLPKESQQQPLIIPTPIFSLHVLPPASDPLSFAPLLPLEPEFPLELTQANEQLLIENPQRLEESKQLIYDYLNTHSFPWLFLLILIGVGGIGWIFYLTQDVWLQRLNNKIKIDISPKQQIEEALQTLQKRQLLEQGKWQEMYDEMTAILLKALQLRLGLKIQSMTTGEIEQELESSTLLSPKQKGEISLLLNEIDQIKFACKIPLPAETKQVYQHQKEIVKELFSN